MVLTCANWIFEIVKNCIDIARKDNTTREILIFNWLNIFFWLPVINTSGSKTVALEIERKKTIWKTGKSPTKVFIKIICDIKKTSLNINQ